MPAYSSMINFYCYFLSPSLPSLTSIHLSLSLYLCLSLSFCLFVSFCLSVLLSVSLLCLFFSLSLFVCHCLSLSLSLSLSCTIRMSIIGTPFSVQIEFRCRTCGRRWVSIRYGPTEMDQACVRCNTTVRAHHWRWIYTDWYRLVFSLMCASV